MPGTATINNVNITGNLTFNTAEDAPCTITSSTVTGTLSNSGAGIVTVTNVGSTLAAIGTRVVQQFAGQIIQTVPFGSSALHTDNLGVTTYTESTVSLFVINMTAADGFHTLKYTKRGFKPQTVTVDMTGGGTKNLPELVLIPDSGAVDTTTDFTTTDLTNAQNVYDAIGQYATTATGITQDLTTIVKTFGAIEFGSLNVTQNAGAANAISLASGTLTVKTSNFTAGDTWRSSGNWTGALLGNNERIRFANLDSEILFSAIDSFTFYPTQADRDSNTSPGQTLTSPATYRYLYGSTVSAVLLADTVYVTADSVNTRYLTIVVLAQGNTVFSFDQLALIQLSLATALEILNTKPTLVQIEASATLAKEATNVKTLNAALAGL